MDRNKNHYRYVFSSGYSEIMTPIEAHKFAHKHKIDIVSGPGYIERKREKSFDGFGWHDSLQMSFKGPAHYRSYLKEHGMVEAGMNDKPVEKEFKKPVWDEAMIWKTINVYGIQLDGRLIEALLSGELDYPEEAHFHE